MNHDGRTLRRRLGLKMMQVGTKDLLSTKLHIQCRTSWPYLKPCSIILFVQDHPYRHNYHLILETQSVEKDIRPLAVMKIDACSPRSRHSTSARSDMAGFSIRETPPVSLSQPMLSNWSR